MVQDGVNAGALALSATGAAVVGYALTGLMRSYALARGVVDVPNHRSSHTVPTPRGGGVGIVVPTLLAIAVAASLDRLAPQTAIGLGGGGTLIAAVGWTDDRRGLSSAVRAFAHVVASIWLVAWLGGFPTFDVGGRVLSLGAWGSVLAVFGVAWSTNLYNFMDGVDGIAALEALVVGGVGGGLLFAGGAPGLALVAWAIAASSLGFLVWNRPPARIFMGDVGSGLLGFLFAGVALAGERSRAAPSLLWLLLLGAFVGDATITVVRRMARGETWYAAHRLHAYQRLVQAGWTHRRVDFAALLLNVPLTALAIVAWRTPGALPGALAAGAAIVLVAYGLVERRLPFPTRASRSS